MKSKEIHKGKPAVKKAKKPVEPLKEGRDKIKKDDETCALTEAVTVESCCCEEVCC